MGNWFSSWFGTEEKSTQVVEDKISGGAISGNFNTTVNYFVDLHSTTHGKVLDVHEKVNYLLTSVIIIVVVGVIYFLYSKLRKYCLVAKERKAVRGEAIMRSTMRRFISTQVGNTGSSNDCEEM